ncbi:ribonuclease H-like domain-containing protein [Tanacetum coccineum]
MFSHTIRNYWQKLKKKKKIKAKVEKWHNSSKNLGKLLNTQMSANDKFGLGYGDHRYDGILSYENEVLQSVFMNKESDLENQPLNDRFAEGMHVVPPPMTGNYMPTRPEIEIDYSQFTYGPKQTQPSESESQSSECDTCESNISTEPSELVSEPVVIESNVESQPKDYPHRALKNKGIVDSGCSRHMSGNKAYLDEFQDFNGGPVAFGGSKGYITSKGKIKTGKLDFKDVCFVKELQHFNLFSVSRMCDKKNKVLFTDSECLVLSPEFKLPDENQVLLKIPRQNNMYSFNLENIVPTGGLACLIAKATTDESNKWHRRLFARKSDEGFLVGYSLQSKAFRVYNLETKRVEENLHITFLENKPNVAGKGPTWLFDLDYLTDSMNYHPVSSENQANLHAGQQEANQNAAVTTDDKRAGPREEEQVFMDDLERLKKQEKEAYEEAEALRKKFETLVIKEGAAKPSSTNIFSTVSTPAKASSTNPLNTASIPVSTASPYEGLTSPYEGLSLDDPTHSEEDDSEIPPLEDIYQNSTDGIFTTSSYDDEGAVADFTNLETVVNVSPIPTSRIHSTHPRALILGDPNSAVQTRSKVNTSSGAHAFVSYKISEALEDESWVDAIRGTIDKTLFLKKDKHDIILVQVYVDDIIFGSTKKSWCDEFEALMKSRFQMSSMGELTFFLGLQVKQKADGIFIIQDKYVAEILKKFDFTNVKTASTPIETQKPLVKDEEASDVDVHLYRLQGHSKDFPLSASQRIFLIQNQMLDYGFNFMNTKMYIDNESTICIVKNPVYHSKTKHIAIRHHFIRDAYEKKLIQVLKIHTDDNVADLLTKAFDLSLKGFRESLSRATNGTEALLLLTLFFLWLDKVSIVSVKLVPLGKVCTALELLKKNTDEALISTFTTLSISSKMAVLDSCPKHNMVAYLEKSKGNEEFHDIIDFLKRSSINFALTVSPTISTTFVEQFWTSTKSKTINNVRHITTKVAGKSVSISEASIRSDLRFDDADGIDTLRNQAIFNAIQQMGYEGDLTDEGASSERPFEALPTPSPAPTSKVPYEPQTDSSPAQTSEVPIEHQPNPSPRPSPTTTIPASIPESSGENLGGHSSSEKSLSGNEGDMTIQGVYDLCLSLCKQVSDQAKEIQALKAQITKLKKQAKPVIKHHKAYLKSVSLKQRFPRKSFSKKHRVHKEYVSKQGRKFAKGESSVQRDPLFDEMPEDTIDHMETENAESEGRTREMGNEDKDIDERMLSTEDVLSTDKEGVSTDFEKVSTDRPIVSTDRSKVSTDRQIEGTDTQIEGAEDQVKGSDEHNEGTEDKNEGTKEILKGIEEQREGTEEKVESTDGQVKEANKNKPPTKNQLRNQMMTYLKHMGNYKHAELKIKKFEEVQALYEKIKRSDEISSLLGLAEDERVDQEDE